MRKLLICILTIILLLPALSTALAGDPATPADPELVKSLLPDYTLKQGTIDGRVMRLLMEKPDGTLVFVGCVQGAWNEWQLTESTPLPGGTILGVENFVDSLGIPVGHYFVAVDVSPTPSELWGVTAIYGDEIIQMGRDWVSKEVHPIYGHFGFNPWYDITTVDWSTLPLTYEEAVAGLDGSAYAKVNNPNPEDRLRLRTNPNKESAPIGKFYNGTPVRVLEKGDEWCKVDVFGTEGYMMTRYLAFGDTAADVQYAAPWLFLEDEEAEFWVHSYSFNQNLRTGYHRYMKDSERFYVVGVNENESMYILWLPDDGCMGYTFAGYLTPGNG